MISLVFGSLQEMDQKHVRLASSVYFDYEGFSRGGEEVSSVFKVRFQNHEERAYVLAHQWERVQILAFQWEILKIDSFNISLAAPYS